MMYFTPSNKRPPCEHGAIITPYHRHGSGTVDGRAWILDNGAFSGKYSDTTFYDFLQKMQPYRETCRMVVVPDVVGDCAATLTLYAEHAPRIRALGWPVAYVAQDGAEHHPLPDCDALFVGGTTAWKMGTGARRIIRHAKRSGLYVHIGRVNSLRRFIHFQMLGADSCDGTCMAFAPDKQGRNIARWTSQPALFTLED